MDLRLFLAVMKRYKKLVIPGLVLAVVLSGLAYKSAKGTPLWEAQAEVMISQANAPYPTSGKYGDNVGYLSALSGIYAAVANGDAVEQGARRYSGVTGIVQSAEVIDPSTGNPLPLMTMTASAGTATGAVKLATSATRALQEYVAKQQEAGGIAASQRIRFSLINNGMKPELASGSHITTPLLVFVGLLAAVITLAFILENLNPRSAEALGRVPAPSGPVAMPNPNTPYLRPAEEIAPQNGGGADRRRSAVLAKLVNGHHAAAERPRTLSEHE